MIDITAPGHRLHRATTTINALVIMAAKITEDKFADAMKPFGGLLLKTSLSEQDELATELATELAEGN